MKIKVAINSCHGGFGLSLAAAQRLYELEEPPAWAHYALYLEKNNVIAGSDEWFEHRYYNISRTSSNLIQVIEELKDAANGDCARLSIIEIDIDYLIEAKLDEIDGYESLDIPGAVKVLTTDRHRP